MKRFPGKLGGFEGMLCALLLFATIVTIHGGSGPVQLGGSDFATFIDGLPSTQGVLVEFYAHWCPTCQQFQPTYEVVAEYFNAEPKVQPEVVVGRVDCAKEDKLCNQFGIRRYPTLRFGPPAAFKGGAEDKRLVDFEGQRTAVNIVKWLGKQKGVTYNYDPSQESQQERSSVSVSSLPRPSAKQADLLDVEKATGLAFKYVLDTSELLKGSESQQAFAAFLKIVKSSHPVERCRSGATKAYEALPQLWPPEKTDGPRAALKDLVICGVPEEEDWRACKGSTPNRRGYTCGLWMLFHSLAGRLEPKDTGGSAWMAAVKGYVQHFFQCSDCAQHFTEMASEAAAAAVRSQRQAVLWAWRAHNEVNRRLESVEKNSGSGDPAFPKKQWPPAELCPICRLPSLSKQAEVVWNENEVYRFLLKFYHGIPEAGQVSQQLLRAPTVGGRKTLHGTSEPKGNRHVAPLLVVIALVAVVGIFARRRMRQTRKIVSL